MSSFTLNNTVAFKSSHLFRNSLILLLRIAILERRKYRTRDITRSHYRDYEHINQTPAKLQHYTQTPPLELPSQCQTPQRMDTFWIDINRNSQGKKLISNPDSQIF